ncbi:Type I transmembrane sorting receptor [Metarhizium rileyi]|uniref:Type I transmembrane sorting receptor n=1 Tax=Metarhizium rileyi (strain RCEF 4871) TaxID=1649241 RepID=A0A5C6GNR7_METRR|nr:Type I transmembrane sorting receptor [Metarhizium rileyi]
MLQTFGTFIASLAVAANLAACLPTTGQGKTLSINVVHNKNFKPNGPLALAKAYNKYKAPLPADLASVVSRIERDLGLQKRQGNGTGTGTGSDPTKPPPGSGDLEYLAEVDIGTPAQKLLLDFDTGSSDLWVFSNETQKSRISGQKIYDVNSSSSAKSLDGASWSIKYGDGSSCSGDVYLDRVTIGGLTVKQQAVESAKNVSSQFTKDSSQNSGLLGLAFDQINTVKPARQKTWFSNIKDSLKAPLFTANLKHAADGTYNFGYIDDKEHDGEIAYTEVDSSQGFWGFTASGYAVGDGDLQSSPILTGIADTGTTLLLIDNEVVEKYYSKVQGARQNRQQGGYVFNCSAELPDFSFGVGKAKVTIPGSIINYAPTETDSSTCFGGIQSSGGIGQSIFGDIALKAALVVFDAGKNRLGWAPKKT